MHQLRLVADNNKECAFVASERSLPCRLNDAFIQLLCRARGGAVLEVWHKKHGWQPVYSSEGMGIIVRNPLALDYDGLKCAIRYTLLLFDTRPSEAERAALRERAQTLARHHRALELRRNFYIVGSRKSAPVTVAMAAERNHMTQ